VKEKRSFKRFDLLSALAVFGVLLVLLFESFFIFELYRKDYSKMEPYLPGFMKEWFASPLVPAEESTEAVVVEPAPDEDESAEPVVAEPVPDEVQPAAPVEEETSPSTNAAPAASEELEPDSDDAELVPLGYWLKKRAPELRAPFLI
jgi:hypothetical protein